MRAEGGGAEKGWEQLLTKVEHKVLSNRALGYRAEIKPGPQAWGRPLSPGFRLPQTGGNMENTGNLLCSVKGLWGTKVSKLHVHTLIKC